MANTLNLGNGDWATKENSLLGYNSENGNYKPLPFDFTRASNGTFVNKSGLIETAASGVPRIDFLGNTSGALKLEPQSTNLITYSEDFSNAAWLKGGATIVGGFTSPSINNNAYKLVENSSNSTHYIGMVNQALNVSYSVFAKKGEKKWILLTSHWSSGSDFRGQFFDLENGIVGSGGDANGKIEDYGNGWYRCSIEANSSPSSLFTVMLAESDGVELYQGNGTDGVYIWGAQNTDTKLSSYIPTNGSTVQRAAETCNESGNSEVFNSQEGLLYVRMNAFDNNSRISLSDGSTSNRVSFKITDDNIDFQYRVGGNYSYRVNVDVNNYLTNKILISYNNGLFVGYLNGFAISDKISGTSLGDGVINRLNLNDGDVSDGFKGRVKEIAYYDEILTDEELEYMTSYRSLNEMVTELNLNAL